MRIPWALQPGGAGTVVHLYTLMEPYSPHGSLAWFSRVLASPQPDWPPRTVITGFPFYDKGPAEPVGLDPTLEDFLEGGAPPVVFTLGSAAVFDPGTFYEQSLTAVRRMGLRAVLLVGKEGMSSLAQAPSDRIYIGEYAPYSALFPRAELIVHQGGIGTTAQALRAGRPMLVVPYSHDQPDNAERVVRLGVARTISRSSYTWQKAEAAVRALRTDRGVIGRARALGAQLQAEDGVAAACSAIDELVCRG